MSGASVITTPGNGRDNIKSVVWGALVNGDTGAVIGPDFDLWSDRSVQIAGTFGAAGSVQIEGSNDNVNWSILSSPDGTSLAFTTAGLKQILQNCLYLRPHVTAGDGTTLLSVAMAMRLPTIRQG
jgi:hypothetical protein